MTSNHYMSFADNFIDLFNKKDHGSKEYEKHVLNIMNLSQSVFPSTYEMVLEQSHGECDFVDTVSGKKYDAKMPFESWQIEMVTNGPKHAPEFEKWVQVMLNEAEEFDLSEIKRNPEYSVKETKLYKLIEKAVTRDKNDENIVFFIPFPIVEAEPEDIFSQFATDYLHCISHCLEESINLNGREIYAIFLSTERGIFAVRNIKEYNTDYVEYHEMDQYFIYEVK